MSPVVRIVCLNKTSLGGSTGRALSLTGLLSLMKETGKVYDCDVIDAIVPTMADRTINHRQTYGDASSCTGSNFKEYGHADLRKTGFGFMMADMWWKQAGFKPKIEEDTRDMVTNETFHVRCGGDCGDCFSQNLSVRVQPGRAEVTGKRVLLGNTLEPNALFDNDVSTSTALPSFFTLELQPMATKVHVSVLLEYECFSANELRDVPIRIGSDSNMTKKEKKKDFVMTSCAGTTTRSTNNGCQLSVDCSPAAYSDVVVVFVGFPKGGTLNVKEIVFNSMP